MGPEGYLERQCPRRRELEDLGTTHQFQASRCTTLPLPNPFLNRPERSSSPRDRPSSQIHPAVLLPPTSPDLRRVLDLTEVATWEVGGGGRGRRLASLVE